MAQKHSFSYRKCFYSLLNRRGETIAIKKIQMEGWECGSVVTLA
jgi:hypothetical protein